SPLHRGLSPREDQMIAKDVMTPKPVTATVRATVAEVLDVMRELEIRHVPVVDRGVLVGMVSDRDLARVDVAQVLALQGAEGLSQELATPITRIMSTDVISVEPDTEVTDVVGLLIEHRVGALPVVQPDTRTVVGIISYIDVLRALQDQFER
ncbi:MAG TPA: CBS domain-containing protein, partial [Candidatus Methylomirabilis sp.]|nr:CBS domain-containing protein [Candidatus Methylomirabilis sp.]